MTLGCVCLLLHQIKKSVAKRAFGARKKQKQKKPTDILAKNLIPTTSLYSEQLLETCDLLIQLQLIGVSLVAQWLRICLLMQGTRVRALV